jgi:KUP system potassium uptake protein
MLAALGVVFGDIGTSPLYALRECFAGAGGLPVTADNAIGTVSLILWVTLISIVSVKYVAFVMRADNRGEGGILALVTLVSQLKYRSKTNLVPYILLLGIVGAALLFSDGIITPAISVLSAVEGLNVATPMFGPYVVPLSLVILVALFMFQARGTARVGALFGPVILVWFSTMGVVGLASVVQHPGILAALNPYYAVTFLIHNGWRDFAVLGSIFLAVTGVEMLYADMGHFGKKPIRKAWFMVVLPGLVLNYLGQGAYLLGAPTSVENLFFRLAPEWFLYPLVILATLATIVASQAVISGAFSLARQSVQLGLWPRIQIRHTSDSTIGQVYVPFVNMCLLIGVVVLILVFKKSTNLASAYGIAVSADMLFTTGLMVALARYKWESKLWMLLPVAGFFICIDGAFFAANVIKITSGGWVVIAIAAALFILMKAWVDGREVLRKSIAADSLPLDVFLADVKDHLPLRVPGVAVFLSGNPSIVPRALLHNLKHNKVLHERTVILSVRNEESSHLLEQERVETGDLGNGIHRVLLRFGYSETPDIPRQLRRIDNLGFRFDPMQTTYFLGREALIVSNRSRGMMQWRKRLFWFLSHNAQSATNFFHLPVNRVVELGAQVEL